MFTENERPAPSEYGQLPEETAPQREFYDRAMQALNKDFAPFLDQIQGPNKETIRAMYAVLHWMLGEDYDYSLPEHGIAPKVSDLDYQDFQNNLAMIERYIEENKQRH